MLRLAIAVVAAAAVLALPSSAFADHTDPFAAARDGQSDLVLDEATFDENVGHTEESGEVLACGGIGYGKTAWYRFRAERSGPHTVATFGSNFDTVLSVYNTGAGPAIPGVPQRIGCHDDTDGANDRTSFVDFNATAGQFYYVQVGGVEFDDGTFDEGDIEVAAFQPPPNDNRANAETVGIGGAVFGYNFNTSQETGERGDCNGVSYGSTVWYRATAPAIGDASITVTSTDMDPVVAVYPAGSNTPLGCNDDGPGQTTSASLTGRVSPGVYDIQVGGLVGDDEQGTFEIRVTFAADTDLDDDGSATGQDCNDGNPSIRPGVPEQVNNDVDENCDNIREFDRDGDGSRVPGSPGDCDDGNAARSPLKPEVPGNGVDENCDNVVTPYDLIPSRVVSAWDLGRVTRMKELVLSNARRGSTVTLQCRRGCKLKTKRIKIRRNARQMQLQKRLTKRQRRFGPKARLTITLSGPGWSPKVTIYRMRPGKVPRRQELCYADRREC